MIIRPRYLSVAILAGVAIVVGSASGQTVVDDPYRPLEVAAPKWPPFYKPDVSDAKYSQLMAGGWCQMTGKRAREYYASKRLNVNSLPSSSFEGTVTRIDAGRIEAVEKLHGTKTVLIVHNSPAVSSVGVHGTGSLDSLVPGAFVHFVGSVDEGGVVRMPIERLDLTTAARRPPETAIPNHTQNLGGVVLRHEPSRLILAMPPGSIRRAVVNLAPQAVVTIDLSDYRLASAGDMVSAKGRVYRASASAPTLFFAEQIDLALHRDPHP